MIESYLCGCLYFTANRLARIMNKMADEAFAPIGLSGTYAFLIMVVNETPGITQKQLCEKLHIAPSTSTRFVDKLVVKGIVSRKQEGKQVYIYPTDKAKELNKQIADCWKNLYDGYSKVLGQEAGDNLTHFIHNACEKLES